MSIFTFENPIQFSYYIHFIIIYGFSLTLAIAAIIYKKKNTKKLRGLNRMLKDNAFTLTIYAITGFLLLFFRYAFVYFLSMPFLHILNFIIAGLFILSQTKKFYTRNFKKPTSTTEATN
jgi:hypothetical protein